MAARALLSEATVMHIVAVVTINTATARGIYLFARSRMTRHARQLLVRAINYETRFLMMIEVPDTPVAHVMTIVTGCP